MSVERDLLLAGLVLTRLLLIVTMVPFLGANNAPGPVKIGLTGLLVLIVWPFVQSTLPSHLVLTFPLYMGLLLKEALVGFLMGYVTSLLLYAVEMAGQLIDIARAANQIQLMVPEQKERSSAFGSLNFQLALVLFFIADLHVVFFDTLISSFKHIPIFQFPPFPSPTSPFFEQTLRLASHVFEVGICLAMPVGLVCLLIDIGFGLINRVAPQINAYFMSLPAKALLGVVIFLAALPYAVEQYLQHGQRFLLLLRRMLAFG